MSKSSQRGFAAVETVLIVIIVALLAGVGYYVWHTNQQTKATLDAASKSAQISPQKVTKKPAASSSVSSGSDSNQSFLTFSEWGVKIPLNSPISDAYYTYKNGYVYLSVRALSSTDCSADSTTLGSVMRYTADEKDSYSGELYVNEIKNAKKVGQYYYSYTHPQAACSDDQKVLAQADADMAAFKTAVSNIQAQ